MLDIAPNGFACAGTWNAPAYTVCTPGNIGMVQVTASALGATSAPTLIFVHAPIDNIQVSVVPPVNSPPPACPNQQALPAACNVPFNRERPPTTASRRTRSQTLQATAYSQGVDITASVGPFTWTEANTGVGTITPIVNSTFNVATNQATASPGTPGQTQVIASASGVYSQPYNFETCPVQCIALQLGENGQYTDQTSFVVGKGTSETITATAVDVQGCIVPKPPLTWVSSAAGRACHGRRHHGMRRRHHLHRHHSPARRGRDHGILHAAYLQRRLPAESGESSRTLRPPTGLSRHRHFRIGNRCHRLRPACWQPVRIVTATSCATWAFITLRLPRTFLVPRSDCPRHPIL